jgi:type 1 glutamine amidotransferase
MKRSIVTHLLLLALSCAAPAVDKLRPIKALMVCGGCCHDYEAQKKILSEGISARANVEFTVVHEGIPKGKDDGRAHRVSIYEKPNWWNGFDIVVHNECFGGVTDDAFVEGIAAAHKSGVPAVMLHCTSHSYRNAMTDEWRMAVGITSKSHEKNRDLEVKAIKGDHPVMKGFPSPWRNKADELYKNEHIWPNVIPLAQAYGQDTSKDHVVIWLNTYGKAKVFATTLGHANHTMSDPVYLDLVTRGLLWTLDRLKADGTPVEGYGPVVK